MFVQSLKECVHNTCLHPHMTVMRTLSVQIMQIHQQTHCLQVLTHDGSSVKGKADIMTKLSSIVELHMAFGMTYQVQHIDMQPWPEVRAGVHSIKLGLYVRNLPLVIVHF